MRAYVHVVTQQTRPLTHIQRLQTTSIVSLCARSTPKIALWWRHCAAPSQARRSSGQLHGACTHPPAHKHHKVTMLLYVAAQGSRVLLLLLLALLLLPACHSQQAAAAAAAAAAEPASLPGAPVPAADAVIQWARQHGAEVNVAVREVPGGRLVVAPRDIKAGEVLVSMPQELCFVAEDVEGLAPARLWGQLRQPDASHAPYFSGTYLPGRRDVRTYMHVPPTYMPLLQNDELARALQASQTALQQAWQQHRQVYVDAAGDATMTLEDLTYSMALLQTRLFYFEHVGAMLVPVADMANHANACPHSISSPLVSTCGPDSQRGCVVWRAAADIPAGGEACYAYTRHMLNDRALLQYGFLMDDVADELNGIDRHDFVAAKGIWANQQHGKPPPFTGTADETRQELARLVHLRDSMLATDASLAAGLAPDPHVDADGELLRQLLQWRQQRVAAINGEIERLSSRVGEEPLPAGAEQQQAGATQTCANEKVT